MRILGILVFLICAALAGAFPYEIIRFEFDGELHPDGNMAVRETLRVRFNESRRGIFRKIPIHYDTGKGTTRDIYLSGISVTDESGRSLTTKVTREGRYLQIRIGDENIWFNPGTEKTYVIRYDAEGMVNWFDETSDWVPTAELYWGITGEEWDTAIQAVDFRIRFPELDPREPIQARVIYGPYGSRLSFTRAGISEKTYDPVTGSTLAITPSEVRGGRNASTPPYNGLTVVLALPAHVIAKPTLAQQAGRLLQANLGFAIPLILLVPMLFLWWRYGKDPHGGPLVVQFDPPDGIGGPELGALLDERVDQRDLAAGIVSLAVKGYLTIIPKEEGLIFKKRTADMKLTGKEAGPELTPFERKLLTKLKRCGSVIDESDLRRHVAPDVAELRNEVYEGLVDKGYYLTSPQKAREAWGCAGVVAIVALGAVFTFISPFQSPFPSIVGGIVALILLWNFSRGMPRRTLQGSQALSKARGFEEFVRRARSPELEWLSQKHPDAALFETYLPHAIAMGLTREWAQAFEGIVQEMPRWYSAPHGTPFHPVYFSDDLGSISESVGSAAAVPPRSSGGGGGSSGFSSGGGFSGGGFGGGGGGSW